MLCFESTRRKISKLLTTPALGSTICILIGNIIARRISMNVSDKIRSLRRRSGLTLEKLGKRCGMTKGYLSKLERNKQLPPISTLQTIAQALDVEVADFFTEKSGNDNDNPNLDILHKGEERSAANNGKVASYGYAYVPLVRSLRGKQMSPLLMVINQGQTDAFTHDSEEFVFVVKGSIELLYDGKRHALSEGDSVYFDSRRKHRFVNNRAEPAVLVAVNYNYRRF